MSAATIITLPLIDEAHAALHVAMESSPSGAVQAAMVRLDEALGLYSRLCADDEADPGGAALWASAEGVENATGALIAAMAEREAAKRGKTNKTGTAGGAS